jgi:hypothetical protein
MQGKVLKHWPCHEKLQRLTVNCIKNMIFKFFGSGGKNTQYSFENFSTLQKIHKKICIYSFVCVASCSAAWAQNLGIFKLLACNKKVSLFQTSI